MPASVNSGRLQDSLKSHLYAKVTPIGTMTIDNHNGISERNHRDKKKVDLYSKNYTAPSQKIHDYYSHLLAYSSPLFLLPCINESSAPSLLRN